MNTLKWYALKVKGGKETQIKAAIEDTMKEYNWQDQLGDIIVPQQKSYKVRNGKRKLVTRSLGYLFIQFILAKDGHIEEAVRKIEGVQGFLGNTGGYSFKNPPSPVSTAEIDKMVGKINKTNIVNEEATLGLHLGDSVRIIDGLLQGSKGIIGEISKDKRKITINIKIFGSWTKTVVSDTQVEKVTP